MKKTFIYELNHLYSESVLGYVTQMLTGFSTLCETGIVLTSDPLWKLVLKEYPQLCIEENNAKGKLTAIESAFNSAQSDVLILLDDQMMGPVFPLDEMNRRIESAPNDTWFLAQGAPMMGIRTNCVEGKTIALKFLTTAPKTRYKKKFQQAQPIHALYDLSSVLLSSETPFFDLPLRVVRDEKCPFFLPAIFSSNYRGILRKSVGFTTRDFYLFLKNNWDVNPLWDYLLRFVHQQDLFRNLHLMHVLPTRISARTQIDQQIALVMHLTHEESFAQTLLFAQRMLPTADVYITTNSAPMKAQIEETFHGLPCAKLQVRVIESRGHNVSSLLIGVADVVHDYDYVCFYHDKKAKSNEPGSVAIGLSYQCQENLIGSQDFVRNVIQTFQDNPRLGMLSPPPPHHANYFATMDTAHWGSRFARTQKFCNQLGWSVPMNEDKPLLSAFSNCFWFRPKALQPLYAQHFSYDDFPKSSNKLVHLIERVYGACVQQAGYYPAYLMSDTYSQLEYTNLHYYVRECNTVFHRHGVYSYDDKMHNKRR